MNIFDAGNQPLQSISLQQEEGTDSTVYVIRVPSLAGQFLAADDLPEARVFVRENGTLDAFQDIALTPIDLAPYDGTIQNFDLYVQTGLVAGIESVAVRVRVTYNP